MLNKLFDLMSSNNINSYMITNFNYFNDDIINYVINLRLDKFKLKGLLYIINNGVLYRTSDKEYYKIIKLIKNTNSEEECMNLCNELTIKNVEEIVKEQIPPVEEIKLMKIGPLFKRK